MQLENTIRTSHTNHFAIIQKLGTKIKSPGGIHGEPKQQAGHSSHHQFCFPRYLVNETSLESKFRVFPKPSIMASVYQYKSLNYGQIIIIPLFFFLKVLHRERLGLQHLLPHCRRMQSHSVQFRLLVYYFIVHLRCFVHCRWYCLGYLRE